MVVSISPLSDTLLYLGAVEEALCFGWIDGVKKKNPQNQLLQGLSPRAKKSSWTELNKERARRLERLRLLTDNWRKALPDMSSNAFIIDEVIEKRLKENEQTYTNFMKFDKYVWGME